MTGAPFLTNSSLYELGFRYGGPTVMAFVRWLEQQASVDMVDILLFTGSSGVTHELFPATAVSRTCRLECWNDDSTAFAMSTINEENFEEHLPLFHAEAEDLPVFAILERIGVCSPSEKFMADIGLPGNTIVTSQNISVLSSFLWAYRWEILKVCRRARQKLFHFLLSAGVADGMRVGIVELGWTGAAQERLNRFLQQTFDVETFGYHFCLTDDLECLQRRSTLAMEAMITTDKFPQSFVQSIQDHRNLIEMLFMSGNRSHTCHEIRRGITAFNCKDQIPTLRPLWTLLQDADALAAYQHWS